MVRNLCLKLLKLCLFLSLANAKVLDGVGQLPGSPALMKRLAETICADIHDFMFTDQASADACPENFNNVDSVSSLRSEVKVRCRWSAATLQLEAAPSSWWQAVVLVPDKEEEAAISYTLLWPGATRGELDVSSPRANYSLYSSLLRHGRASFWRRHEAVLAWDEYKSYLPEHKDYNVQVQFVNYSRSEAKERVTGIITWNHTGDADACFTFTNYCKELLSVDVWPDQERRAVVPDLPLNHSCRVEVAGLHGTTELEYRTPGRERLLGKDANIKDVSNNATLQVPKIVFIEAVEQGAGWAVRVAWAPPALAPDRYSLVLTADAQHTLNVTGNATEAIVEGVTGEGVYNVSLYAYRGTFRAHTFRRAVFIEGSTEWRWVGAAGGAWAFGALCLLALALCRLRRRGRRGAAGEPKGQESKPLEDFLLTLESECEDQWEMKSEQLMLHEVIGEGAFGKVRRGVLAPAGKEVAVKMLKDFPSLDEVRAFRLEMEVMKSVGAHVHVVSLLGCCSGARPLIVQEYCARGDLLRFLRRSWDVMVSKRNAMYYNNNIEGDYRNDLFKSKSQREHCHLVVNKMYERGFCEPELTSADLLSFCRQIAMGMEFLAANRLVHRDLAARNVLVTRDRTLKIADFGLSRDVYEDNQYRQKGNGKMPLKWMAPESLTRKVYTSQSDVWSFGVVVWEVMTLGGAPYPDVPAARLPRLLLAGYRMPRPVNCSKQLYDVMQSCWRASPRARPSFPALHRQLDELLQCTCTGDYLSLELELEHAPPSPSLRFAYLKTILRGRRAWTRETYERPLEPPPRRKHNHYSTPPATLAMAPA